MSRTRNGDYNLLISNHIFLHLNVSEIIGLERLMSIQLMAGKNLIRPHRKCAFHLLFLQVASVWFVIDTSSLAVNTWGLNHHFLSVKLFPLFCGNIFVELTSCTYLQLSI